MLLTRILACLLWGQICTDSVLQPFHFSLFSNETPCTIIRGKQFRVKHFMSQSFPDIGPNGRAGDMFFQILLKLRMFFWPMFMIFSEKLHPQLPKKYFLQLGNVKIVNNFTIKYVSKIQFLLFLFIRVQTNTLLYHDQTKISHAHRRNS